MAAVGADLIVMGIAQAFNTVGGIITGGQQNKAARDKAAAQQAALEEQNRAKYSQTVVSGLEADKDRRLERERMKLDAAQSDKAPEKTSLYVFAGIAVVAFIIVAVLLFNKK